MWLTALSIRRPLMILMVVLAIMLGGLVAYRAMAVELIPSIRIPVVGVVVVYPGAGPREVEARVTKPLENALAGSPGLKTMRSTSGDGASTILMEFRDGMDPDAAIQDAERRINRVLPSLPEGLRPPTVMKYDFADQPIVVAGVNWESNPNGVYRLVDETIRPRIEAIEGVATVQLYGGLEREIRVNVDRGRLEARGLSLAHVTGALAAANVSAPSGYVRDGISEYSVRVYGLYQELEQLGNLVLSAGSGGGIVRLKDVASIEDGFKKQSIISRINGREGVTLLIQKQQMANTVAVSQGVQKLLREMGPGLPAGVEVAIVIDEARFVKQSLEGVQSSLQEAVIIVALVLLLFLHTWRSTVIVLISIPTSLIATFGVMWAMGFSLNMMTMMGLALTVGILVDDSIVILENIHRHMKLGESPFTAAFNGRAEIGGAALAITLVDVVVFAPLAFSTGITAQFFRQFSGAIVVATLFSLLVSFTLTPMLASRWLTADAEERSPLAPLWRRWEAGYQRVVDGYRRVLGRALQLRWLVLMVGFLAFVSGVALLGFGVVGTEFMTQSDEGMFTLSVEMPTGTALPATNQAVEELETRLRQLPEVQSFISIVGTSSQHYGGQARSASIYVNLKPLSERERGIAAVADDVRTITASIPGMKGQVSLASMVNFGGQAIQVSVRGADVDTLTRLAAQVEEIIRSTPGTIDVSNSATLGSPEMRIEIDHQKLSDLGLSTVQVASALRTALDGTVATELRRENEDKVDIRVLYASPTDGASDIASIPDIPLTTPLGTRVKLSQVSRLVPVDGPTEINRMERMRQVTVGANINGRPLGDVTADINRAMGRIPLPEGYRILMQGDAEAQDDAFNSLGLAMAFSILLMYMLMVALYDSLVYPLVIMGSLPLASVGAIGALAITGDTLNIMSLVGLLMLTGLVAKNAILLVDYTNTLRRRGYSRWDALVEAGPTRLRPIVMTTAAMVFAMMPLALKMGEGAESRAPMGIVVIGGLLTSMVLTLVVVPAAYTVMDDLQQWVAARFGGAPARGDSRPELPTVDASFMETVRVTVR